MKILALYSIKGGVGKTACAVNLAFYATRNGYRTLVWDIDPQAASSYYFRIKPKIKGGSHHLIAGDSDLKVLIKGTDFDNLDLLPSDFSFRNLDLILDGWKKPARRLKKLLKPLSKDYDFIFLDCPPGISLLSEAIIEAADILLSPVIPTTLSLRTLDQLKQFMADKRLDKALLAFFSMADRRKKMHREIMNTVLENYPCFLHTVIPYASDIEMMGIKRMPLGAYSHSSPSTTAYNDLWLEILERSNE